MDFNQLARQAGLEVESYETGIIDQVGLFFKLVDVLYEMEKQLYPGETKNGSVLFARR